jgi:hypothetical protein
MPHHPVATLRIETRDCLPVEIRQESAYGLAFHVRLNTQQPGDCLVEIKNTPCLIDHEHTILDCVEERLKKVPLAGETLHDGLQPFGIKPPNPPEHLV